MTTSTLTILSNVLGWSYFLAWSISFYPQAILNYQRKRVDGLSFEYLAYNITGFLAYTIYNIVSYIEQHRLDETKSVKINDIAFSVHACILTSIQILQCFVYERNNQKLNWKHASICVFIWVFAAYNIILAFGNYIPWYRASEHDHYEYSYSVVDSLGLTKVFISFIKYVPQAWMNYKRKSTVGWSIGNVALDFTGGVLSFFQQFVDAENHQNWGEITSNAPKLFLALESIIFDLLFMFQHYVLYRDAAPYVVLYDDKQQQQQQQQVQREYEGSQSLMGERNKYMHTIVSDDAIIKAL